MCACAQVGELHRQLADAERLVEHEVQLRTAAEAEAANLTESAGGSTTRCNAAHHAATQYSMLQSSTACCNAVQHAATQYNTLQRSTTRCNAVQHVADDWNGRVAVDCACAHERVSMQVCACKRTHASAHPRVHRHEPTPPPASAAMRWVPLLCAASFVPNVVTSGPALQCPRPDCNTL